jgi:geranylgeranyl pyrophosphate synthase
VTRGLTDSHLETGALFNMLVRLMGAKSHSPSILDLSRLMTLLGRYFQIRDDYMNLTSLEVCVQLNLVMIDSKKTLV